MIKKHSGIFTLAKDQFLNTDLDTAWEFFSSPKNLSFITPAYMGFKITSETEEKMYPGQIITYRIGLLPFLKTNWVTEITHVKEKEYFVDEQRAGPYKIWHHEHFFEKKENKVFIKDKITFKLPFGFAGNIAYHLFIKKELIKIFEYRFNKLEKIFNNKNHNFSSHKNI